jgi:hypothetical protein
MNSYFFQQEETSEGLREWEDGTTTESQEFFVGTETIEEMKVS